MIDRWTDDGRTEEMLHARKNMLLSHSLHKRGNDEASLIQSGFKSTTPFLSEAIIPKISELVANKTNSECASSQLSHCDTGNHQLLVYEHLTQDSLVRYISFVKSVFQLRVQNTCILYSRLSLSRIPRDSLK